MLAPQLTVLPLQPKAFRVPPFLNCTLGSVLCLALLGMGGPATASQSVLALQTFLEFRGCRPGPLDGQVGNATRTAIRAFNADTGLAITLETGEASLAEIPTDKVCIDHFLPLDPFERVKLWGVSPELASICRAESWQPIKVLVDITQPEGSGIRASQDVGDVSASASRASHACLAGVGNGCDAIVHALEAYAESDGFAYSGPGPRSERSAQFTETRLEFNHAMVKLLGGYLLAKEQGHVVEREATIEGWVSRIVDFYNEPTRYFQDNHLTLAANVNALAYRLTGEERFAERVRKQWQATFAGMSADGSFPTEVERGSSALHYTSFEIALLLQQAEIMLLSGINLYDTPEVTKLHKAVSFSLDAFENWDAILKYARKNSAAITTNWRVQDLRYDRLWNWAYFVYMQRFPHHANSERMHMLTIDPRSCDQDEPGAPKSCSSRDARVSFLTLLQEDPGHSGGIDWVNGYCAYGPFERIDVRLLEAVGAADPYAGTYALLWSFVNVNRPEDPPTGAGADTLELSGGTGRIVVPNFTSGREGPTDANRVALKVEYDSEGAIRISGGMDLFQEGRSPHTELTGDLDEGQATGIWTDGDRIIVEIVRR